MENEIDILRRQVKNLKAEIQSLRQEQHSSEQGCRFHIACKQAALDLQEEMKFRESFIQSLPGFFVVINSKGKTILINDSMLQALGYTKDEVVGKDFLATFVPESEREKVSKVFQELINKNEPTISENQIIAKDGKKLMMEWQGRCVFSKNGKVDCFCGVGTNITERKRIEESLRKSEERFRQIVENANEGIWTIDGQHRVVFVNQRMASMLGYSPEEMIGRCADSFIFAEDLQDHNEQMKRRQRGESAAYERRMLCKEGNAVWAIVSASPIMDAEGRFAGSYGMFTDISDLKRTEEALRTLSARQEAILSAVPEIIMEVDCNKVYTWSNLAGVEFFGEDVVGKQAAFYFEGEQDTYATVQPLFNGNDEVFYVESWQRRRDGQKRLLAWWCRVLKDAQGTMTGALAIAHDITDRKLAEEALRKSQDRYRTLIESAPIGIFTTSSSGQPLAINLAMARILGCISEEEALERYADLSNNLYVQPERRNEFIRQLLQSGRVENFEYEARAATGRNIWLNMNARIANRTEDGSFTIEGFATDITERKLADEALRDSEERHRRIIEASSDAIILRSSGGVVIYANPAALKLFRANHPTDLIGKRYLALVHPDDRAISAGRVKKSLDENWIAPLREHRLLALDGQVVHVESTGMPFKYRGDTQHFGVFRDITERKLAEQEKQKTETQLRQAQKMEAIGSLAGGIAHDFNNILSVIIGNTELLEMSGVSSDAKNGLDQILSASQRAKQLVRQILTFSRQGEQQKMLISLKPVVRETLDFLRASIPSTIQLQHYIKPDSGTIIADSTQMQQVLMNLCTNAAHAMEEGGGVLKIVLDNKTIAEKDVRLDPEIEQGEYVKLTVSDTGHGIEPSVLDRIFDPYFTTKGPDKGTGLGLAVVHGIVKSHGGIIRVYSEVGKGTVFDVLLPRADEAPKKEEKAVRLLPSGTERILVVDDEKPLADIYEKMLGMLGYQVEIRTSPVEALEAVRMNPQKYDLVITDMTMPQMTGYSLSKKLMEIRPGLPVILCTGFSDLVNEEKARSVGILAFLLKPVPLHDLANTMRKVLDETHREKHS